ncbi:MAG: DEAD/DEAH box helicase family protein [Victivallales bacterium]
MDELKIGHILKTEAETRKKLIDAKLKEAGWDVANLAQVSQEFDISVPLPNGVAEPRTPYEGYQFSDYVLFGRDGKPLGVVEAKKTSKDAALGREQAKQYCYHIQKQYGCKLPFCFYTNGLDIFFWDLENYPPRKVVGYPTRDDLERFQYIREHRKRLADELINTEIAGRDYQIRAIRAVMEGIEKKQRNFLLVMATGTGKTRTCIALVDALMRAGHAEKVLFLVDRIALRGQGLDAFKEHLPNEPRWPKEGEKLIAKDRCIYISTYPTMLNIIREEGNTLSPHFFDLIVIDESHRSIYNTYGEVLDYFKLNPEGKEATVQIPLPVRFVGIRIDKIENAIDLKEDAISKKEIGKLRKQIQELPQNSVIIHEAATALQKIADDNFRTNLPHEKIEFLRAEIKPPFRTVSQTDFKAMRFQKDLLKNVYKNRRAKFIQFIRHILGLERLESFPEAVAKAFEQFIHGHTTLSSRQLEFLNLLKNVMLEKETVQKQDLIESPFTVLHPKGIRGLFTPFEINDILELTKRLAS